MNIFGRKKQIVMMRKAICANDMINFSYNVMIAVSILIAVFMVIEIMVVDNIEEVNLNFIFFLLMYSLQAESLDIYSFRYTRPESISSQSSLYDTFSIIPIKQRDVRQIAFFHWLYRFLAISISVVGLNIAVLVREDIFYMREGIALYSILVIIFFSLIYYSSISIAGDRLRFQIVHQTIRIVGIFAFLICMFLSLLFDKQVLQMISKYDSHIGLGNLTGIPLIIITVLIIPGSFLLFYKGTYQKSRLCSWRV